MQKEPQKLRHQLTWFLLLWVGGVAGLASVGYLIRYWLGLS